MSAPRRCIITIEYDATPMLLSDWQSMTDEEIKECFADSPELIQEMDFAGETIVQKVRRE